MALVPQDDLVNDDLVSTQKSQPLRMLQRVANETNHEDKKRKCAE